MPIVMMDVDGITRDDVPEKNINVIDDIGIDASGLKKIKENLKKIDIYKREKEDCPLGRGNWVCDQYLGDHIFCIRLPIGMKKEDVLFYFQPLIDIARSNQN